MHEDDLTLEDLSGKEFRTCAMILAIVCLVVGAMVGLLIWA